MENGIERSLGRIEGKQELILVKLDSLEASFKEHVQQDQVSFSSVRTLVYTIRDELKKQFESAASDRKEHLDEQDLKLDAIIQDKAVAKGKWTFTQKVAVGIGALVTFAWGVFTWAFPHH